MKSSPFLIYPIGRPDLDALRRIAIQTFGETFSASNSKENMDEYFSRCYNEQILVKELEEPESWWYFIEFHGILAGYLKVNVGHAQTEMKEQGGFEVERIYVLKEFHGKGVGAALMDFAIGLCKDLKKQYIWLGVHEHNFRALRFYEKYGFSEFSDHVFMMGLQSQRDLLLRKEIHPAE